MIYRIRQLIISIQANWLGIVLVLILIVALGSLMLSLYFGYKTRPQPLTCFNIYVATEQVAQGATVDPRKVVTPVEVCVKGLILPEQLPRVAPFPVPGEGVKVIARSQIGAGEIVLGRDFQVTYPISYYLFYHHPNLGYHNLGDEIIIYFPIRQEDRELYGLPEGAAILVVTGRCLQMIAGKEGLCMFTVDTATLRTMDGEEIEMVEGEAFNLAVIKLGELIFQPIYPTEVITP